MKQGYKIILVIIAILVLDEVSRIISIDGLFYVALFIGIIFYIGFINTSINELRIRVKQLESKQENDEVKGKIG